MKDRPNFQRLHEVGFNLKCCALCTHSRFYEGEDSPWGLCTKYQAEGADLRIHKLGRCSRGFKADDPSVTQAMLSAFKEFL
jgi:hypothetical protein